MLVGETGGIVGTMAKLSAAARAKLPDSAFAYVDSRGDRRLPINDEAHVRNALARFERVRFEDDAARERARVRLLRAAKRYGIVPVGFITGQLREERRRGPALDVPTGAMALLMTDIEGSTGLLEALGEGYPSVLTKVRRIHRGEVRRCGGVEIDARGDEYFAVFEEAAGAVRAAVAIQLAMAGAEWPSRVRVRIGLHAGRPTHTDGGLVGLSVHTVSRVCSAGHGGQIIATERLREMVRASCPREIRFRSAGQHHLRGISGGHELFRVTAPGLAARFPPLRTG